jgi:hypothetical protein
LKAAFGRQYVADMALLRRAFDSRDGTVEKLSGEDETRWDWQAVK